MNTHERIRINVPKVVHETIDGETIVLNLDKGNYYSLLGAGADIWKLIESGTPAREIVENMQRDYEGTKENIEAAVNRFLTELVQEGLSIYETAHASDDAGFPQVRRPDAPAGKVKKAVFNPPILNKYSDMQDLLLLDPIHDVDAEAGWPTSKPAIRPEFGTRQSPGNAP